METLLSLLILAVWLYVLFLQLDAYSTLINTKFRFSFFALRDKLALLVCNGQINEKSWEYKYVIDALNYHISAVERLSIVEVVEAFIEYHTSPDEDHAIQRLNRTADNDAVKAILVEYMQTVHCMIVRNSRWQFRFIRIAAALIRRFGLSPSPQAKSAIVNPGPALSAISAHRNILQTGFATA